MFLTKITAKLLLRWLHSGRSNDRASTFFMLQILQGVPKDVTLQFGCASFHNSPILIFFVSTPNFDLAKHMKRRMYYPTSPLLRAMPNKKHCLSGTLPFGISPRVSKLRKGSNTYNHQHATKRSNIWAQSFLCSRYLQYRT